MATDEDITIFPLASGSLTQIESTQPQYNRYTAEEIHTPSEPTLREQGLDEPLMQNSMRP